MLNKIIFNNETEQLRLNILFTVICHCEMQERGNKFKPLTKKEVQRPVNSV